jgi:hypothetical protein
MPRCLVQREHPNRPGHRERATGFKDRAEVCGNVARQRVAIDALDLPPHAALEALHQPVGFFDHRRLPFPR